MGGRYLRVVQLRPWVLANALGNVGSVVTVGDVVVWGLLRRPHASRSEGQLSPLTCAISHHSDLVAGGLRVTYPMSDGGADSVRDELGEILGLTTAAMTPLGAVLPSQGTIRVSISLPRPLFPGENLKSIGLAGDCDMGVAPSLEALSREQWTWWSVAKVGWWCVVRSMWFCRSWCRWLHNYLMGRTSAFPGTTARWAWLLSIKQRTKGYINVE
jgi:hypothetical protein